MALTEESVKARKTLEHLIFSYIREYNKRFPDEKVTNVFLYHQLIIGQVEPELHQVILRTSSMKGM